MKTKHKIGLGLLTLGLLVTLAALYLHHHPVAVVQPAGTIGYRERNLIIFTASLSVAVVVPVFVLLGYFGYKYRETNHKAKYAPDLEGSHMAEIIWWLVPGVLLAIISTVTWWSSYALDPFKPLASAKPTMHIQVVALDWKWLFIYPNQNIATVNEAAVPTGTPVDFDITSDAVMTSFWVPQLGGQMYAMPGMMTQLNLQANKPGNYRGVAANISGKGFADMTFNIKALSDQDFNGWLADKYRAPNSLTEKSYAQLAKPGIVTKSQYYSTVQSSLYDTIIMKYMMPTVGAQTNTAEVTF